MKKVILIALLAGILLNVLAFSEAFSAGTFTVFGPKDYARATGKPATMTDNFSVLDPNASYALHIYNGGKSNQFKEKVSSALISLNGAEVVRPNEFSQNVFHIQKPITLVTGNALEVELRSKPGSGLTIEIIGVDKDKPTIVATLAPSPNAAGWNNTDVTVSFVCSDTTSGIASCPGPMQVQQEGANQVITGTAIDIAGNTASASVTVNIDKTPPVVTILSPVPGTNLQDPSVIVHGTANDALSGVAAITCNGTLATVSNSSFTCNVSLVEGQNVVETVATDIAGNIGYSSITLTFAPPALELAYVDQFERIVEFNDIGGYYRPVVPTLPPGFYSLGHYGQGDLGTPRGGFVLVARELKPGALARPVDYTEMLPDTGWFGCGFQLWRPVPPPGYVCLGQLVGVGTLNDDFPPKSECLKPSTDEMRCVRQDLTVPAKVGNAIVMFPYASAYRIPTWQIIPADENGVFVGTFTTAGLFLYDDYRITPPNNPLSTIDARRVKRYELDSAAVEELIQLYGPDLYFYWQYPGSSWYSREDYFPDDPEYVLNNGTALEKAFVQNEWDYGSFSFQGLGSVNTSAASLMWPDFVGFIKNCPEFGDPSFRYYLSFDDSLKPGSLDRAKALVRVRPWNSVFTDLQFWFFYPFNGPGRAEVCITGNDCVVQHFGELGRHYGDWEQVTVRVDNRTKQLISVYMSQHGGGQWIPRNYFGQELQFNGTHPRIYVAKYSHAHYPTAGTYDYERVYETHWFEATQSVDLRDLTNGNGPVFSTYLPGKYRIISSAVPGYEVTEPDWLQFQGRWGQYELLSEDISYIFSLYTYKDVGAGPTGPAMKRSWVYGDSGDWWWTRRLEGTEACFDGIDNNGNGEIDCHDPDCWIADPVCIQNGWWDCHVWPGSHCPDGTSP